CRFPECAEAETACREFRGEPTSRDGLRHRHVRGRELRRSGVPVRERRCNAKLPVRRDDRRGWPSLGLQRVQAEYSKPKRTGLKTGHYKTVRKKALAKKVRCILPLIKTSEPSRASKV